METRGRVTSIDEVPAELARRPQAAATGLLNQLCAPVGTDSDFLVAAVPLEPVDPTCLLDALPYEPAVLWAPSSDDALCGLGAAARIDGEGPGRFDQVRRALSTLWGRVAVSPLAPDDAPKPRVLGGFAFQPGSASSGAWANLGDASFLLPRWTYVRQDDTGWLLAVRDLRQADGGLTQLASELERIIEALRPQRNDPQPLPPAPRSLTASKADEHSFRTPDAQWRQRVESILRAIGRGGIHKVVIARSVTVGVDPDRPASALLDALRARGEEGTRFAIRRGPTTFLGSTPERLVWKQGDSVMTEALAGTRDLGDEDALLASSKDRREHAFVVEAIRNALAPLCVRLQIPDQPQLHPLPHLVHLRSPIRGDLRPGTDILDLVDALHPTPAVGGVPRDEALAWIARNEPLQRGWYAAPLGWVDATGDGEFCVALRCALLNSAQAHLFAGSGIVEGSEANQEFEETEWKLRTLRSALTQVEEGGRR